MRKALAALDSYYNTEFLNAIQCQPTFPYRNFYVAFGEDAARVSFTYISQPHSSKLVFFCKTADDQPICVKFVKRYSVEAHTACANDDFAPELLAVNHLPGGWLMVVMVQINVGDYTSFEPRLGLEPVINERVTQLHQKGFVHGDIRRENILVHRIERSKFLMVDFDWAGRIGDVRYPPNVNRGLGLWRPTDARDGEIILADHDLQMIAALFQ